MKEQFAWRHFYWYLTNEGIQYLRDYLHLPPEIVPATLRRSRPETGRPRPKGNLWLGGDSCVSRKKQKVRLCVLDNVGEVRQLDVSFQHRVV